jgi:hypothetical protein
MRKSSKILVAGAAAVLVATGGSAFTAGNTIASGSKVGYGDTTVSGIAVSDVQYIVSTLDGSKIDKVKFVSTDTTASGSTGTLTIKNSAGSLVVASLSCGTPTADTSTPVKYTFTCDPTTDPAATDVVTVGFTVTKSAV